MQHRKSARQRGDLHCLDRLSHTRAFAHRAAQVPIQRRKCAVRQHGTGHQFAYFHRQSGRGGCPYQPGQILMGFFKSRVHGIEPRPLAHAARNGTGSRTARNGFGWWRNPLDGYRRCITEYFVAQLLMQRNQIRQCVVDGGKTTKDRRSLESLYDFAQCCARRKWSSMVGYARQPRITAATISRYGTPSAGAPGDQTIRVSALRAPSYAGSMRASQSYSLKAYASTGVVALTARLRYRTATGATVEPVPPCIFSGCMIKAN